MPRVRCVRGNDIVFARGAVRGRRRGEGTPPCAFYGVRCKAGRVVREADPYGSVTGRASGIGRGEIF